MEIRIGVQHAPREIVLESNDTPESVRAQVEKAASSDGFLVLTDEKGRMYVVPGPKIAYVEIGAQSTARVGFAST